MSYFKQITQRDSLAELALIMLPVAVAEVLGHVADICGGAGWLRLKPER